MVSAPRGGEKKKKQGRVPRGASSLLALASLGRWEGCQGQGHVGTCGPVEEMLGSRKEQPAAARVREVQGTPETRPEILASPAGPGPLYNLW